MTTKSHPSPTHHSSKYILILGPLLFLLYINDITDNLQTGIHLYADDAVLMCNLNSTANPIKKINEDLQRLYTWSQKWHMSLNASKTKYMVISNKQNRNIYPPVQLNNTTREQVNCFKQLGLYFDDRMTWETHINHIASVANRKIGIIWKINQQFPRKCSETFCTRYGRPILDYGCSAYDNCSRHLVDKLDAVQRNAAIACTRDVSQNTINCITIRTRLVYPRNTSKVFPPIEHI